MVMCIFKVQLFVLLGGILVLFVVFLFAVERFVHLFSQVSFLAVSAQRLCFVHFLSLNVLILFVSVWSSGLAVSSSVTCLLPFVPELCLLLFFSHFGAKLHLFLVASHVLSLMEVVSSELTAYFFDW